MCADVIVLYQFPISHYCEKVRWALQYKDLTYKKINLLPGLHIKKAKKLTSKSSVPILKHDKIIISESSEIITYLDNTFPQNSLTPINEELKNQTLEWEKFADKEIGPDVRKICYHTLLDHPDITIPFFTKDGPWYGNFIIKIMYPVLSVKMREFMQLNNKTATLTSKRLSQAIDKVHAHIHDKEYFVGDTFTRADLAVASLLAPLCMPNKYGLDWPEKYPDPLHSTVESLASKLDWVIKMYTKHR